jgi:hypothetical protein
MDLRELKAKGGFVSTEPVPVEVTWKHGGTSDTFTTYVVRPSGGAVERIAFTKDERSKMAAFVAECIRLGEEKERLTYEQAYSLEFGLLFALSDAVNKLATLDAGKAKN